MVHSILLIFLIVSSAMDWKRKEISLVWCIIFGTLGMGINLFWYMQGIRTIGAIFGSVAPGIGMLLLAVLTRQKVGVGDGLALIVTGFYIGMEQTIFSLMFGLVFAAVFSVGVIVIKKVERTYEIPFLPFLTIGILLAVSGGSK